MKCNFDIFWKQIPSMMIDYVHRITKKIMILSTFARSFFERIVKFAAGYFKAVTTYMKLQ